MCDRKASDQKLPSPLIVIPKMNPDDLIPLSAKVPLPEKEQQTTNPNWNLLLSCQPLPMSDFKAEATVSALKPEPNLLANALKVRVDTITVTFYNRLYVSILMATQFDLIDFGNS